jgi:HlyD family secretion protein
MKPSDRFRRDGEFETLHYHGPRDDVGAQGTALILELQRLQKSLDLGLQDERQWPPPIDDRLEARHARPPGGRRGGDAHSPRRGAVGRMVDICLGNSWFSSRADRKDASARAANSQAAPGPTRPTRRNSKAEAKRPLPAHRNDAFAKFEGGQTAIDSKRPTLRDGAPEVKRSPIDHRRERPARAAPPWIDDLRAPPDIERITKPAVEIKALQAPRSDNQLPTVSDTPSSDRMKPVRLAVANYADGLKSACAFLVEHGRGTTVEDNPDTPLAVGVGHAFRGELRTGLRVLIVSAGVIGGWASFVPLSGAVVLPGTLVVESKVKKVQHPTGGIVTKIDVQDGSHVAAGELIARLDETQARSNYQMFSQQLEQIRMRLGRLTAERDGAEELTAPAEPLARAGNEGLKKLMASERSLFNARTTARRSQKELLQSHVSQLGEQINGLDAQIKSKAEQVTLISKELEGVQGLYEKGLVPLTRLTTLQREAARLEGERGQLVSAIAEAKSKISEAEIQILRIDQDFRTELMKDLREAQDKEAELIEKTVAARDVLNRTEIRAPANGIVHQLSIHTIGGVVAPGEVIMEVVPDADGLEVEAHLPPQDVDQVHPGQTTYVRFSAFNQRTTPQLSGLVSYVSADLTSDKQTNASYYTVRVTLPPNERLRLGGLQLVSGMPTEVFLQTGSRTMMSYLFKPMTEQLGRMFNER